MLLALWPLIMPMVKQPVRPIIEREVIPRRQYATVDKLRDDDAICILLLM